MSPIGRIIIVLNLVLSAVFFGAASSHLSSAEDVSQQLSDKEAELLSVTTAKDDQIASLVAEKSNFEESAGSFREERDRLKEESDRTKSELAQIQGEYDALKAQIDSIQASLDGYAAANQQQTQAVNDANDLARAAESAREAAEGERDEAMSTASDATEQLALLEKDISDAQKQIAALEKDKQGLDTKLAMLAEYTNVSLSELLTQPDIDAFVLQVHPGEDYTLVSLNKGQADGVKKGFTFSIFNNGQYKGDVKVDNVQANMCTALLVRPVEGKSIAAGDNASTQI